MLHSQCSLSHFHAICWKMIHGVSPSCGLTTTAPVLGSGPGMGGSQPAVKWPSSLHAPVCLQPGEGTGWLLPKQHQGGSCFLGQGGQTVCFLSQKQGKEQGGFTCWMPGECSAWGTGGSCSSSALHRGFLLSSNHSLGQGNAFFQLSILLGLHC